MQGGVRTMEIIVVEVVREALGAVRTGVVGTGVGPLSGEGLDEAFGLAVGLRPVRTSEAMLEAELVTGGGKEFGAIRGAAAVGSLTMRCGEPGHRVTVAIVASRRSGR